MMREQNAISSEKNEQRETPPVNRDDQRTKNVRDQRNGEAVTE